MILSAQSDEVVWDFFIAHSSADGPRAEELYTVLSQNARVFLDSFCLLPGDDWQLELKQAQRRSRITLVLVSSHSEAAYYEYEEIANAIDMSRQAGSPHRVVPILLEDVPNDAIPYGLRRKHSLTIDARGLASVANSLTELLAWMNGVPPKPSVNPDTAESRRVREICRRLSYEKLARSRLALRELADIARLSSAAAHEVIITELKEFLLDIDELRWRVIPAPIRDLRKSVLNVIRLAAKGNLSEFFQRGEFEGLDLYGMEFSYARLSRVSFSHCFLVEADFSASELDRANFAAANIRNVNFANANLSAVDFTNADWFNASGLSDSQMFQVLRETLLECPADIEAMHNELSSRYGLPFSAWSTRVKEQLLDTWQEYLRPGGLRDIVRG